MVLPTGQRPRRLPWSAAGYYDTPGQIVTCM